MRLLLLLVGPVLGWYRAGAFVEEVACSSVGLTVMLNRSDPEVSRMINDPNSQPVVYVFNHKTRTDCGSSLKQFNGNTSSVNYNLTIPYGDKCDVLLADLEPTYSTAETTIVLEDHRDDFETQRNQLIHKVFCIYTRSVQTLRFNDVSTGQKVIASTGGKPKPDVKMLFRTINGEPLRTATFGQYVEFYVSLYPDSAYKGIVPKECVFSDTEDVFSPQAKRFTFVQNSCPVEVMSDLIEPVTSINQEVYFSKFKTFRFGNQSTVFAHCSVKVCMDRTECIQPCFKMFNNTNLNAARLRFRHKRDVGGNSESMRNDEVQLSNQLRILDKEEVSQIMKAEKSNMDCVVAPASIDHRMLIGMATLTALCILSMTAAVYMAMVLRRRRKAESFDVYSAFKSSTASTPPSMTFSTSGYPSYTPRTLECYR